MPTVDALLPLQGPGTLELLVAGIGGVAVGTYVVVNSPGPLLKARDIATNEETPAAEVASEDGVVEVEGTAQPLEETLQSPHTDTECLAYDYRKKRIEHHDSGVDDFDDHGADHDDHRTVHQLAHDHATVPFRVEDESGSVPVDPTGANLDIEQDEHDGSGQIVHEESRIDIGETVHVWGQRVDGADAVGDSSVAVGDGPEVDYRIGTGSEMRAVAQKGIQGLAGFVVGLLMIVGGLAALGIVIGVL
jgi:hypothetical protein